MRPRSGIASPHSENASLPQACWPAWSADVCACTGAQMSVTASAAIAGRISFMKFLPVAPGGNAARPATFRHGNATAPRVSRTIGNFWSGRRDSNPRPLVSQTSALTGLRHAPTGTARTIGTGPPLRNCRMARCPKRNSPVRSSHSGRAAAPITPRQRNRAGGTWPRNERSLSGPAPASPDPAAAFGRSPTMKNTIRYTALAAALLAGTAAASAQTVITTEPDYVAPPVVVAPAPAYVAPAPGVVVEED